MEVGFMGQYSYDDGAAFTFDGGFGATGHLCHLTSVPFGNIQFCAIRALAE